MAAERRFVTRTDVEDAARAGRTLELGPRDVITDEAAQRARDLGVAMQRSAGPGGNPKSPNDGRLRSAVRAAVVAELGHEPPGLDAALDKVLGASRG